MRRTFRDEYLLLALLASAAIFGAAQGPMAAQGPGAAGPNYYVGDTTLRKVEINTQDYPDAVCNGEPPRLSFYAGSAEAWLLHC